MTSVRRSAVWVRGHGPVMRGGVRRAFRRTDDVRQRMAGRPARVPAQAREEAVAPEPDVEADLSVAPRGRAVTARSGDAQPVIVDELLEDDDARLGGGEIEGEERRRAPRAPDGSARPSSPRPHAESCSDWREPDSSAARGPRPQTGRSRRRSPSRAKVAMSRGAESRVVLPASSAQPHPACDPQFRWTVSP